MKTPKVLIKDNGYSFQITSAKETKHFRQKDLLDGKTYAFPSQMPPKIQTVLSRPGDRWALSLSDGSTHLVDLTNPFPSRLFRGIRSLLTMAPDKVSGTEGFLGMIENAAVLIEKGKISWVGQETAFKKEFASTRYEEIDLGGVLCLPGFVDPHTHVLFAGERAKEYGLRQKGTPYVEILEAGGGILSTVEATRAASIEELVSQTLPRLHTMLSYGVTTCEVKSGYGLSLEDEIKMLEAIRILDAAQPVDLVPTLLAAHAFPKEWRADREGFLRLITEKILPKVVQEKLATSFDVFCDRGAFTLEETKRLFTAAKDAGLRVRVHAEEIEHTGAAALAAQFDGLSADHLEKIDQTGIDEMAKSNIVAVLLPGTAVTLGLEAPPVKAFQASNVPIAIGTDLNPGSCFLDNLPLAASLGCGLFRLDVETGLRSITRHAARAAGVEDTAGGIFPGAKGDLLAYNFTSAEHLFYRFGQLHPAWVVKSGRTLIQS